MTSAAVQTIHGPPAPVDQTIEQDERMLRVGLPSVRVARISDPAVTIGVAQRGVEVSSLEARARGVPVLRRGSGGTGLLHSPGDVAWAVVAPRTWLQSHRNLQQAYLSLGSGVTRALRRLGVESSWETTPSIFEPYCLLNGRGRVLVVQGRILGGAAQHLTRLALLHHGVINGHQDSAEIARTFAAPPEALERWLTDLFRVGIRTPQVDQLESFLAAELATTLESLRPAHPSPVDP